MVSVPTNKALYARVKAEAKGKFKVWPSAYGSGWLVKEYKRRGGKYRVTSKSKRKSSKKRRKSSKKRRKSSKKRRKSSKKRRKSSKKRRKSSKKRRKSSKKRRKSSKKRRKSSKKRRKSSKKRRKSSKKRSRAPVKKSPIKTYYKKSPIASKPKKSKKNKKITIRSRPQLSRQMSVEDRNFYRPSGRLPRPDERIPPELRMRSRQQYLRRLSRPGAPTIPPLPYYRGSRAPKRTKKNSKRRKSKKSKSKRSVQSGLGRWFAEEWINVCKLPKIVPCGRNKAKWKNYPYCRPRRRINKGTPKTARELSKAEIDRRCKRKRSSPKKRVTGKSKSRRRK
jgi:histone H1/5